MQYVNRYSASFALIAVGKAKAAYKGNKNLFTKKELIAPSLDRLSIINMHSSFITLC